ncbi:MAG: hypothetical protein M1159_03950 [Candidatus Thermoplasmatota archaeon]|jgi:hypothetical protein|nr:hypothetical protein [Candidatus Thermoplasmatota archaeon]MCL5787591.1 hypothetical protein [Candidatus Thermoplasmatota archaeon]
MNPVVDLEIIKSALLYGEPADAMDRIESRMKRIKRLTDIGEKQYTDHVLFLSKMKEYLQGNLSTSDLHDFLIKKNIFQIDDYETFVESFVYFCEYSRDRYNLKFPNYDSKRCDDL